MSEQEMLVRSHHPYSPSTLQCREACPKYTPREGSNSKAAADGTAQHAAAEVAEDSPVLSDQQALAVVECLKFRDERAKLYPGCQLLLEEYLPIDGLPVDYWEQTPVGRRLFKTRATTAGYVDVSIVSADQKQGEIIDWKFGKWAVEHAEDNLQGIAYVLGFFRKFPRLEQCWVHFIMPHRDEVTSALFTRKDIPRLLLRVRTVVDRAVAAHRIDDDFSTASPHDSACRFCGNLGRCKAIHDIVVKIGQKFRPLLIPKDFTPTTLSDPAEAGKGMELAGVVETWAKAYKSQCNEKVLTSPTFIPEGYEVVQMAKRSVVSVQKVKEAAIAVGVKPDALDAITDIPIGGVEDLVAATAPRGSKEAVKETFGEVILENGGVVMGQPYTFLRKSSKTKAKKESQ